MVEFNNIPSEEFALSIPDKKGIWSFFISEPKSQKLIINIDGEDLFVDSPIKERQIKKLGNKTITLVPPNAIYIQPSAKYLSII
jgi:hypothetical protein